MRRIGGIGGRNDDGVLTRPRPVRRGVLARIPTVTAAGERPRPDGCGQLLGDPGSGSRKILDRYASDPAVFARFVDELRARYGTVEALNEAWGLVFWSHRLASWADLWTPEGNWQPQYDLAWRRFQAKLTTEYVAWQAGIAREYTGDDQFVTTCIAYERQGVEDRTLTQALDVTAGNAYYAMQDALAVPQTGSAAQGWATAGAWTPFLSGDRMYASRQAPFLVTETNAGSIGGPATNYPAYDGQWRQAAWAFVARGAQMIEYWPWHSLHFGTETYWGGVLPHDQRPGRVYEQLAALGAELASVGPWDVRVVLEAT